MNPPCLCMLYLPHTAAYQVNRSDIVYTMPNGVKFFIEKKEKKHYKHKLSGFFFCRH